jgi:hypothetical protein
MEKRSSLAIVLVLLGVGCSSATSSPSTLVPGQVDADGVPSTDARPPPGMLPPPPPSSKTGPAPECPSLREPTSANLGGSNDLRAQLTGIYRSCTGESGLEIRIDPESDTRLLWYSLDERFVRGPSYGTLDIGECEGARCDVTWETNGSFGESSPPHTLTVWSDPTAIALETDPPDPPSAGNGNEWLRVAD